MRCRDVEQFASALVDGELDAATAIEFERHIGMCDACRTRTESERLIKVALQRHLPRVVAPDSLRARIHAELETQFLAGFDVAARPGRGGVWVRIRSLLPVAAAAALILFFLSPGSLVSPGDVQVAGPFMVEDVAGKHASMIPVQVSGPNPERVAQWFQHKVSFPVRPPSFSHVRANLVGGRLERLRQQPAAHLVYDVDGRTVSVLMFAPSRRRLPLDGVPGLCAENGRNVYVGRAWGVNVAFLQKDGVAYALASDGPEQQMLGLTSTFR